MRLLLCRRAMDRGDDQVHNRCFRVCAGDYDDVSFASKAIRVFDAGSIASEARPGDWWSHAQIHSGREACENETAILWASE